MFWLNLVIICNVPLILTDALEKGAVDVNVIKCVTMGPPEAGKTQLKRALLGDFKEAETSTPASTQATPAVDLMVPGEDKWEHLDFDKLQVAVQTTAKEQKFVQKPSWDNSSKTSTNQRSDSEEHSHTDNRTSKIQERNTYFHDLNEEISKTMADSHFDNHKIGIIHNARLIYTVDSGGQPSFLDFHPVTATFAATYLLVYNMQEGLDAKPKMTYRKTKDYRIALPDSTQSNLEILRRSLLTLHHFQPRYHKMHKRLAQLMKTNFIKAAYNPPIIVVGTRRTKSTEEDEDRLKSLYQRITPMGEMITNCFVDSCTSDCTGIQKLRCLVSDDSNTCFFRLPLSWFRLHLMSLALGSREALQALTFKDFLDMCLEENLVSSDVEFEAMVTVFHSLGVFSCPDLEFAQGLNDSLVFTNPNLLFGYVTKILEIPFCVLPKAGKRSLAHLQQRGELTTTALKELNIPDPLGSYQGFHERLLKWLVHWGLAAEMEEEGKWFVPSVLPPKPITFHTSIDENPFSPFPLSISFLQESTEDFTFHYLPEGFFPHFVVKLIKAGYTLSKNDPDHSEAENLTRCRDAIFIIRRKQKFNSKITFNISLIDDATHLSVHLYPADRSVPNARQEAGAVLAELKHKMEETNESLYHCTNDRIAICCPCPCSSKEGRLRDQHIACVDPGEDGSIGITCLHPRRPQMGSWEGTSTDELLNEVMSGLHSKSGTSVHFHCNSCIFHLEGCTFNVFLMPTDQSLERTVSVHQSEIHPQLDVHTTMDDSLNIGPTSGQSCLPHRGVCAPEREEHSYQQSNPDKILPSLGKGKSPKYVGRSSHVQKESRTLNDPPGTCMWCFLSCA